MHLTAVEKEEEEQVAELGSNYNQKKNYFSKRCIDQEEYQKYVEEDGQDKLKRQI